MQTEYFASWAVPELQRVRCGKCLDHVVYSGCSTLNALDSCALRDTNRVKYNSRSAQIFHPAKAKDAEAEQEGQSLLGSISWAAQTVGPSKRQKAQKEDLLCYVGGAVWALDWCPACGKLLAVLLL